MLDRKIVFTKIEFKKYWKTAQVSITPPTFNSDEFLKYLFLVSILKENSNNDFSINYRSFQDFFTAKFVEQLPWNDKEKWYKKFNGNFTRFGLSNGHLYSLLQEMDIYGFDNFCLLPILKNIQIENLQEISDDFIIDEYFKLTDIVIGYDINYDNYVIEFEVSTAFALDVKVNILSMSKMLPPNSVKDEVKKDLKNLFDAPSNLKTISLSDCWKIKELKTFVLSILSIDEIRNYFFQVQEKINEIESKLLESSHH